MSSRRTCAIHFTGWLQCCGVLFIGTALALAFGAATAKMASTWFFSFEAVRLGYAAVYLCLAGLGLAGLRWVHQRWNTRRFLLTVLGASFLIQFGVICAADRGWEWTGDSQIFQQYLTRLSDQGYTKHTLEELSQNYDYRVWTRRAQPFYFLIYKSTGAHAVRGIQIFQALLLTLSLFLTYRLAWLYFGRGTAFWAVALQFIMPFRWFACLDLNHHILGGVYFLLGLWLLAEWLRPGRRLWQTAGLTLCAGLLFPLMQLEGGIDLVYWGATALVLALYGLTGRQSLRQTLGSATALLILPLIISSILLSPLFDRIEEADLYRHESGAIGFMARGWVPETGGEYSYTPEQIDFLTPQEQKVPMQLKLILSQAAYNPRVLLTQLLPIKMAKYGLLGYAAGAEEMLVQNGADRAKQFVESARTAFLLGVLPLTLLGIIGLFPLLQHSTKWLALVLPCSLICCTFVLLGETSPRYSIYIQPFLFIIAALPLSWRWTRPKRLWSQARTPLLVSGGTLLGIWVMAGLILFTARPWLRGQAVEDMRTWPLAPHTRTEPIPDTSAPFEYLLEPQPTPHGTRWGGIQLPPGTLPQKGLVLYALPKGASSSQLRGAQLITEYDTPAGLHRQTNSLPGRIRLEYSPSVGGMFYFESQSELPFTLRIGYATYESEQKTNH